MLRGLLVAKVMAKAKSSADGVLDSFESRRLFGALLGSFCVMTFFLWTLDLDPGNAELLPHLGIYLLPKNITFVMLI